MPFPDRIETERLLLRRLVETDAEEVFARYAQDPEVTRYLRWQPSKSLQETHSALAALVINERAWLVYHRAKVVLLGSIGCRGQCPCLEVGYCFARDAWGHGYATEAVRAIVAMLFEDPTTWRVQATCAVENHASARVLEKTGFTFEGTLRRHQVVPNLGNVPRDVRMYAIVRESDASNPDAD